jgi:hypothetical protein
MPFPLGRSTVSSQSRLRPRSSVRSLLVARRQRAVPARLAALALSWQRHAWAADVSVIVMFSLSVQVIAGEEIAMLAG